MWTKVSAADHLFLLTYGNDLLWDMVFVLIFSIICLFIQININRYCWKRSPVVIYLSKWLVVTNCFHFNNHYVFVYLLKFMSAKAGGTDHLLLFTYVNQLLFKCDFHFKGPFTLASKFVCAFAFVSNCNIVSIGCCIKCTEWNPFFGFMQIIKKNA